MSRFIPIIPVLLVVLAGSGLLLQVDLAAMKTAHPGPYATLSSSPAPIHRTFWLKGNYILNWNDTNPGPFMSVVSGDLVSIMLISEDGFLHAWFLDFNNNLVVDPNEAATLSPNFSSTTTYLNFTFTPVIGTNIPAAGNWTYRCSFHPLPMFGTFRVLPAQISSPTSSALSLGGSKVNTTGTLVIDTRTLNVSGTLTVTAVNSTTGSTTFSKIYSVPNMQMVRPQGSTVYTVRFLLNVAVLPYALSSDLTVQLSGLTMSITAILTRQLDINGDGIVNILDVGVAALAYSSSIGSTKYNPLADFNADGTINILDIGIIALYYARVDLR